MLGSQTAEDFLYGYSQRSASTKYNYKQFVKYGAKADGLQPVSSSVWIDMIIKVPQTQEVLYTPPFWSVIKFAWVQYFCALVFWYYLLYVGFWGKLVRSQVFNTKIVSDFNETALMLRK